MAAAAARSLAAAGRAAARRLTTTSGAASGAASGAGAKQWSKANRLADELVQLVEKNPTTEAELVEVRNIGKELLQILRAPLTEGMTVQELKYYLLEGDVRKLRAGTDFHHNLAFALCGVFGCYMLTLSSGVFNVYLEAKSGDKNLTEDQKKLNKKVDAMDSRLQHLEAKVGVVMTQIDEDDDGDAQTKKSTGWFASWKKWLQ